METVFQKGDQVHLTEAGRKQVRAEKRTVGTVMNESRYPECYVIKWPNLMSRETLHRHFIERV